MSVNGEIDTTGEHDPSDKNLDRFIITQTPLSPEETLPTVFYRQSESPIPFTGISLNEIANKDFSSLAGTWQNEAAATITDPYEIWFGRVQISGDHMTVLGIEHPPYHFSDVVVQNGIAQILFDNLNEMDNKAMELMVYPKGVPMSTMTIGDGQPSSDSADYDINDATKDRLLIFPGRSMSREVTIAATLYKVE